MTGLLNRGMCKNTFIILLNEIKYHQVFHIISKKQQLSISLQLQIFLFELATSSVGVSYFQISQKFGVGEGTVSKCVKRVTKALLALKEKYNNWPNQD